ncbi:ComEC/Rec2 family competence protein [Kouleothrix sp.]|uniref:ComEC/Rec2 family competence protein n=1 Tax=Kouleothrix sp. TaxID=2779161 RepID=UPI00391BF6F3
MTLIILAAAWLIGLVLADLYAPGMALLVALACAGLLLGALARRAPRLRLVALALACAALAGARLELAQVHPVAQSVWLLNDRSELQIEGVVADDPRRGAGDQRATIAAERALVDGRWRAASGLVLAKLPPYPERRYGDRLRLTGRLTTPREAERPGQFDYRQYLARKHIFSLIEPQAVRLVAEGQGSQLWGGLFGLRDRARRVLLRELPEPQASLAVGILLGLQSSIPGDVTADFSATGTSHILVISGWNISIIAAALYSLASGLRLAKRHAFWFILVAIWLYTLFVGATPTVIRAAVMGTIVVLGQRLERPAHAWTTLFAACWAMTLWDPQTLWDLGFQLSALATASLFAFGKGTERLLLRTPLRAGWLDWAREALTATLAAQILALPLILYQFGNLSLIAPVANVALLPVVPYAMLFGALALLGGMARLALGQWLALPAYLFLAWLTEGARWFARVPWASLQLPPFPLWLLLAYYAIVVGAWLWNIGHARPLPSKRRVAPGATLRPAPDPGTRGGAGCS